MPTKTRKRKAPDTNDFSLSNTAPKSRPKRQRMVLEDEEKHEDKDYNVIYHQSIIAVQPQKFKPSSKIAAFDMDSTLVVPKSGAKWPKNKNDWMWMWGDLITNKLSEISSLGFSLLIVTNQAGIATGSQKASDIYQKIISLSKNCNIPIAGVIATNKDQWRKPSCLMLDWFEQTLNDGIQVDRAVSYYVGDAAGREAGWLDSKTKKDFSCSDRKFAHNCGLTFYTPEMFFKNKKPTDKWAWGGIHPEKLLADIQYDAKKDDEMKWFGGKLPIHRSTLEMVIMVGPPGSGKTSLAKKHLVSKGYEWVNRDTLKTQANCQKACENALKGKKNVVVDATHPDRASREAYIGIAKKCGAKVRVFFLDIGKEIAMHLNLVREQRTNGKTKRISSMVYNIFYKKLRENGEPSTKEGIEEIAKISFWPQFEDKKHEQIFKWIY